MIYRRKILDQLVKNDLRTVCNIQKISAGQADDQTTDEIKDRTYVINLDECKSLENYWVTFHVSGDLIYFDSFGVDQILKGNEKLLDNKNITTIIYRVQVYDSIMYWIY